MQSHAIIHNNIGWLLTGYHTVFQRRTWKCWWTRLGTWVSSTWHREGKSHPGVFEQTCRQKDKGSYIYPKRRRTCLDNFSGVLCPALIFPLQDTNIEQWVQQWAINIIRRLEHLNAERLWVNLKNRHLRGDLPAFFKYLMKIYRGDGTRLFLNTRKNRPKLEEEILQLGTIKMISPMKSNQTFEQFAQRTCATSIFSDIQNPAGHGHEKPDLPLKLVLPSAGVSLRCVL